MSWTNVQRKVTAQSTAATSLTASLASAPTAGNLLVASFFLTGTIGGTLTPPSGWTSIGSANGTSITLWVCYRVAASGDPTSWTWTDSDTQKGYLQIDEWSGNSASPLDKSNFVNTSGANPATSLSLTNANELVYFEVISGASASNITLASGFTSLSDSFSTSPSYNDGYEVFSASGATGTQTGSITGATNSAVAMVAFIAGGASGAVLDAGATAAALSAGTLDTAISLNAGAKAPAISTGALLTAIRLAISAIAPAIGTASLGSPIIVISGSGVAVASGAALLVTGIPLDASADAAAAGSAIFATHIQLSASGDAPATGAGALATAILLNSTAAAEAVASGALVTAIPIVGSATAPVTGYAVFVGGKIVDIVSVDVAFAARTAVVNLTSRNAACAFSARTATIKMET